MIKALTHTARFRKCSWEQPPDQYYKIIYHHCSLTAIKINTALSHLHYQDYLA